jgi:mono/diheme cytochrome c family protein
MANGFKLPPTLRLSPPILSGIECLREKAMIGKVALLMLSGAFSVAAAAAEPARDSARAQLLYDTHCIACHTEKVHWRDQKIATDWNTLKSEVDRWQKVGVLGWTGQDILEVTAYLNTLYYKYPVKE